MDKPKVDITGKLYADDMAAYINSLNDLEQSLKRLQELIDKRDVEEALKDRNKCTSDHSQT